MKNKLINVILGLIVVVGIVLCADKSDAIVKYTLSENDTQIFASKYMTYIPSEEEFKRELRLDDYKKKDDFAE